MGGLLGAAVVPAEAAVVTNVPRPAPSQYVIDFEGGKQARLADYRGKIVVLEFLLTYCGHCQAVSRTLQRLNGRYAARGVQIIGAATNDSTGKLLPGFRATTGAAFPLGFVSTPSARAFLMLPDTNPMMMPQVVFIDRQGIIVSQHAGTDDLFKDGSEQRIQMKLEELLAKK